ncbi:hypothetical protein Acor_14040 [Acrocarpospora corrugata]|uniref:EF-hand domain-containing protein n=1 Tax=Acrocarpospora corrugata TaxID=35763 RepID=A0A5M3VX38_9ACTN|nr:EF-hand domain-containing protein [Acrocarpospora corrugata]GER99340.1 hypothetical protein Acor_14040 [Acrocarpospora corrugata]
MADELDQEQLSALRRGFDSIDSDGDGYVTETELLDHFPNLPPEAIGALSRADVDSDGRFSFEEYVRLAGPN